MNMTPKPWHKEFWPWFLMALPASAVIAGIATFYIAAKDTDGLVEDDYYKQGVTINRTLARDRRAAAAHLSAELRFDGARATLTLSGELSARPDRMVLRVLHPTRSGRDQLVLLQYQGDSTYAGDLHIPTQHKWDLVLEDEAKTWRLLGEIDDGNPHHARLKPGAQ